VWVSPERHGAMTGIMKAQIDWIPLAEGAKRPTQGKTLAVMQVSGGSQSFNAVNQLRVLGRWMRMVTIPNQSSVAKAYQEFDEAGRMKPSAYYDHIVVPISTQKGACVDASLCRFLLQPRHPPGFAVRFPQGHGLMPPIQEKVMHQLLRARLMAAAVTGMVLSAPAVSADMLSGFKNQAAERLGGGGSAGAGGLGSLGLGSLGLPSIGAGATSNVAGVL